LDIDLPTRTQMTQEVAILSRKTVEQRQQPLSTTESRFEKIALSDQYRDGVAPQGHTRRTDFIQTDIAENQRDYGLIHTLGKFGINLIRTSSAITATSAMGASRLAG
jgi:hypothetical protein